PRPRRRPRRPAGPSHALRDDGRLHGAFRHQVARRSAERLGAPSRPPPRRRNAVDGRSRSGGRPSPRSILHTRRIRAARPGTRNPMSLEDLRRQIDAIDSDIIRLLNERADVVHEIGVIKKRDGLEIYAPEREEKLLRSLVAKGEGGRLPEDSIRAIYREIMSAALALEEDLKIAYLGPAGTWTHQAAIRKFGHSVKYLPQPGFAEVFEQVERRVADYGVVPIENSTEGAVRDMFRL